MTHVLVPESKILDFIPQRAPIVMVSQIISCTKTEIVTQFQITPENIFVEGDKMQESGMIENIAQTAAAMTGYFAKEQNQPVKRGFIGSVKKLSIIQLPVIGTISTTVKVVTEVMNATVIEGSIAQKGIVVATCEMNIFLEE